MTLIELLESIGGAALQPVWLPVLVWTLLVSVLFPVERTLGPALHPMTRARLHTALLAALPTGVAMAAFVRVPSVNSQLPDVAVTLPAVLATGGASAMPEANSVSFPLAALGLLTCFLVAGALVSGMLLLIDLFRLRTLRAHLPAADDALQQRAARVAREIGLRPDVRVLIDRAGVPLTYGQTRPVIVLPSGDLEDADVDLILRHELVHVLNGDFAWHVVERVIVAFVALHPLVHLLHRRAEMFREMACDATLIGQRPEVRTRYARLLYRYATAAPAASSTAVGIVRYSSLKHRVTAMKDLTYVGSHNPLRTALLAATLLCVGTLAVACSDVTTESASNSTPSAQQTDTTASLGLDDARALVGETGPTARDDSTIFVIVDQMPQILPNAEVAFERLAEEIQYPEQARNAGLEGRVFVQFVVSKDGSVENLTVTRGLGGGLDAEAIRAVKTLRFEPGVQRGQTVPVKMTLPVAFKLDEDAS